jgi:tetratricopeptide (TPR) repeat protein
MASGELWKRLRPDKKSLEMISEEIEKPFDEAEGLGLERHGNKIVELEERGFDIFVSYCFEQSGLPKEGFYKELKPHIFYVEYYLCSFHDHLAYLDRWEKRLEVSKKLYSLEPKNPDFKDLYGEALLYWGYADEGERIYNELIEDFPEKIRHSVHCGDMFFLGHEGMRLNKDFKKAEKYYLIAEKRSAEEIDWQGREPVIQRLSDLYREYGEEQKTEEYRTKRDKFERYYLRDTEEFDDFEDSDDLEIDAEEKEAPPRKIGRSEPCPCGSGKKYKKCRGK